MKTNHLVHTIVTSSDFVECNGAKLYREPMETNGGSKFLILFFKAKFSIFDFKKSLEVTVG
jgi:hypothetical protein